MYSKAALHTKGLGLNRRSGQNLVSKDRCWTPVQENRCKQVNLDKVSKVEG